MGSSSIGAIVIGQTGPTGPRGPKGATGATGIGTGLTGPTGMTAIFVAQVSSFDNGTNFITNYFVQFGITGTKGPTGYTGGLTGQNVGSGLTLYTSVFGQTLSVRGISFTRNLSAEATGGTILVTPQDVSYDVSLVSGITSGRVLYAKTENQIDDTNITYGRTYGEFSFSSILGITPGSLPVYTEFQGNIIEVPSSSEIILGITNGAVYHIQTPIGISGFTLDPSLYNDNELVSVTMFIEGNGLTAFPPNVYFEDSPYSSLFGCGTNIMNLMTNDKGQNWYATIVERGYGLTLCEGFEGIGSCCYVDVDGDYDCVEYLTEAQCAVKNGTFNLFRACGTTCGPVAICCSNGNCVEGIEREECLYFGGKYYAGIECTEQFDSSVGNDIRLCYNPDRPSMVCCTGGTCISDVTATICQNYYGGVPLFGTCCDVNCSANPPRNIIGACCVESGQTCGQETPAGCSALGGVFYGDGTTCGGINCCFDVDIPTYTCCLPDGSCQENQTESECAAQGGITSSAENCLTANCPQPPVNRSEGLCCGQTKQWTSLTKQECLAKDPNAYFYPNPVIGARVHAPYKWKEESILADGSATGGDCIFCDLARKVIKVGGYVSVDFGQLNANIEMVCTTNRKWSVEQIPQYIQNIIDINQDNVPLVLRSIKTKSENPALEIGNFNSTTKNIKYDACCGYVESFDAGFYTYCMYDPFVIGQIFDQKAIKNGSVIQYLPSGLSWNPTQNEMKTFIFDQYLKEINYPLADFKEKVCRGLCSTWNVEVEEAGIINCNCNQSSNCGVNANIGTICDWMKTLITQRLISCVNCDDVNSCAAGPPVPTPSGFSNTYCEYIALGSVSLFDQIATYSSPISCNSLCEQSPYGKRCLSQNNPCSLCSNTDCSGDISTNPCINLPSC